MTKASVLVVEDDAAIRELVVDSGFASEAEKVFERINAVPPAAGFSSVLVPGEPEGRSADKRHTEGSPVAEDTWAEIIAAGASVGVTVS
jgi:LDH2 family malate/lactate/ureidoglycolate dehydrogenase